MGGRDGVCQHRCRYGRNLSSLSSSMSKMVSGFLENERFLFMTSEEDTVDSFSYLLPCWRWPNTEFTVHFQGPCPTPASPRNQTWPLGLKSGCPGGVEAAALWEYLMFCCGIHRKTSCSSPWLPGARSRWMQLLLLWSACSRRGTIKHKLKKIKKAQGFFPWTMADADCSWVRWTWESQPWPSAATSWTCATTPVAPTSTAVIPNSAGASTASAPTSRKASASFPKWKVGSAWTFSFLIHHKNKQFPIQQERVFTGWFSRQRCWN